MVIKWLICIALVVCMLIMSLLLYVGEINIFTYFILMIGSILFFIGNLLEIKNLRKVNFDKFMKEAELLYKDNQPQNALENYQKALEFKSNSLEALMGLAQCHRLLLDLDKAFERCQKATTIFPKSHQPYFVSGLIMLQKNKPKEAAFYLSKVEKLNPDFKDTYYLMGQVYEKLGQMRKAVEKYKKYIDDRSGPIISEASIKVEELERKLNFIDNENINKEKISINRRKYFRIPRADFIQISINDSEEKPAILIDLSAGGCKLLLLSANDVSFGDQIRTSLCLFGEEYVDVLGDVVWRKEPKEITENYGIGSMVGVQFYEFSEIQEKIDNFVNWYLGIDK